MGKDFEETYKNWISESILVIKFHSSFRLFFGFYFIIFAFDMFSRSTSKDNGVNKESSFQIFGHKNLL
ncbi:hypothetical protein BpHYR1_013538 [Brachionus plicatilis]|uniref:Uncharacterized protein n=1 Tax=Brachionus plicatilis TaxID=10195 RepID=A0A3M7SI54_BRAPC|nr:hypothetical protein BpHYR1_013538 [Brachionus plicatilis]